MAVRTPRSVLITGASGGIGRTVALYLSQRGHRVLATGRSLARLADLENEAQAASLPIWTFELDVNDPALVARQMPVILQQAGTLDVVVNNAGYGLWGCLEDLDIDEVQAQFETNLFGLLRVTQAVLPHMRQRGQGTIINVGSVAGHITSPAGGAYAASKAALSAFNAALRMEVWRFGIRVSLIEPGAIHSNFVQNEIAGRRTLDENSPYRSYAARISKRADHFHRRAGDPVKVAKTVEKIMLAHRPRPRYAVGIDARLGITAARILPDWVLEFFVRRVVSG